MKTKLLLMALVLGATTTTTAVAKPLLQVDIETELNVRDHRGAWRPVWAPLSPAIRAGGRKVIRVPSTRDELTAIRLQSGVGATYIYSLTLRYDDGSRETIPVREWLYGHQPMLTFDLPQQRGGLRKIVVSSFAWNPSTFKVAGKRMRSIVYPAPRPLPPPPQTGIVVGKDLTFANTDGYVHVPVGSKLGRFNKLRITSTGPSTFIGHVLVTYATGAHQSIEVNKAFYRGESLELALDGKGPQAVTAITLLAHGDVRAVGPSASKFDLTLL